VERHLERNANSDVSGRVGGGMTPPGGGRLFADLGVAVHEEAPRRLLDELPGLYGNCFCLAESFDIYERSRRRSACETSDPRHVVLYTRRGATVRVLNRRLAIDAAAADRVVEAVFRAHPEVRRIELEAEIAPDRLSRPVRVLRRSDDLVVELPATQDEYEDSLGKATRKHLRQGRNRLRRSHPEFELRVLEASEITLALVEQVFAWNRARIRAKGEPWAYERQPEAPHLLWRLLRSRGTALVGYAEGVPVAGELLFFVGRDCWMHTGGSDAGYDRLGLGLLMVEAGIGESIRRGCRRTHLLWSTPAYKRRLGARPVPCYRLSIFRSSFSRRAYALERWRLLLEERRHVYWRLRKAARTAKAQTGCLARPVLHPAARGRRSAPDQVLHAGHDRRR